MPLAIHVFGPALIKVGPEGAANNQLQNLGFTRDGVRIRTEALFEDIHSDELGGQAGLPVELAYYGERAVVTCELIKWDVTVADLLAKRLSGVQTNTGVIPGPLGRMVFSNGDAFRLVIASLTPGTIGWSFPRAVPREPMEINKGSRPSMMLLVFDCYPVPVPNTSNWLLYEPYTQS